MREILAREATTNVSASSTGQYKKVAIISGHRKP
jgi:hypothetical protein